MFAKLVLVSTLALCAAVAPPRISLDLSAMASAGKLEKPIYRSNDLRPSEKSRQDWTEKCPAGVSTDMTTCPFPVAKAYDHQDKEVTVTTRVYLVDLEGATINQKVAKVDFSKRSTYLFKYDASDLAGNHAEQVVFALILDDTTKPVISMCGGTAEKVEAASKWQLCGMTTAQDNVDGSLTSQIRYTIQNTDKSKPECENVALSVAQKAIDTLTTGRFLVTMTVHDKAGIYGSSSMNNLAFVRKAVEVIDTRKPWIVMEGAIPAYAECGVKYVDGGAFAKDELDTEALGKKIRVSASSTVDSSTVGTYNVAYDASDNAGNNANTGKRMVYVKDTTKPLISLRGEPTTTIYAGKKLKDRGAVVSDLCEKSLKTYKTTWIGRKFSNRKVGKYVRQYTATDKSKNTKSVRRTFVVEDRTAPLIKTVGHQILTLEATRDEEYLDQGAACHDYVDGMLNHAVEVSGQVVNMRIPGKYTLKYDCQDLTGNAATTATRVIHVVDTRCPTVTIKGSNVNYVEAGFPYEDASATATDSLDGDITTQITTDGDTVDTSQAFYSRRSCKEIKAYFTPAKTGEYYITAYNAGAKRFERVLVWCDMTSTMTYYPCKDCTRIQLPYFGLAAKANKGNSCESMGLELAKFEGATGKYSAKVMKAARAKYPTFGRSLVDYLYNHDGSSNNDYLCSTNDQNVNYDKIKGINHGITRSTGHSKIMRAEAGKYVIDFHVQDKAGNKECKTPSRTVIVKDTLPPVISLHLKGHLIHKSGSEKKGLGGEENPAGTHRNPYLVKRYDETHSSVKNDFMAETSVNGWMIAAIASAVTGVALLSFAQKKTDTTVPV
jgi:hypothetical protein